MSVYMIAYILFCLGVAIADYQNSQGYADNVFEQAGYSVLAFILAPLLVGYEVIVRKI